MSGWRSVPRLQGQQGPLAGLVTSEADQALTAPGRPRSLLIQPPCPSTLANAARLVRRRRRSGGCRRRRRCVAATAQARPAAAAAPRTAAGTTAATPAALAGSAAALFATHLLQQPRYLLEPALERIHPLFDRAATRPPRSGQGLRRAGWGWRTRKLRRAGHARSSTVSATGRGGRGDPRLVRVALVQPALEFLEALACSFEVCAGSLEFRPGLLAGAVRVGPALVARPVVARPLLAPRIAAILLAPLGRRRVAPVVVAPGRGHHPKRQSAAEQRGER